jgi:hypothetical protein
VLLNICENQNGEKIIANTGNFRKEPRRMTLRKTFCRLKNNIC